MDSSSRKHATAIYVTKIVGGLLLTVPLGFAVAFAALKLGVSDDPYKAAYGYMQFFLGFWLCWILLVLKR